MKFWVFMFVMLLIVPLSMIFVGNYFYNKPPKSISKRTGYRTKRSMKSNETWLFANKCMGRLWRKVGLLLILTLIPMLFVINKSEDYIGVVGGIISILQVIAIVGTIIPIEKALKENFDEEGNKRV
ncbi:putative membrane protein [Peptoniphilus olsenii]|uniref:Membrane protein n=1 Tax=Peptoniphilus olsenii TaxID=411570 RepID=A0ABV2JAQ8_9FIRM